jgi:deoxyribodipyrimidine photo-lyase
MDLMSAPFVIVWFRNDLRISDNPALQAAVTTGLPILALYVLDTTDGIRPMGTAQRWWLDGSLRSLDRDLAQIGLRLTLKRGIAANVIRELADGAHSVFWNRRYDPAERERDTALKADLAASGVNAKSFNGALLVEPWVLKTGSGKPYQVFTPFWRALLASDALSGPLPTPEGPLRAATAHGEDLDLWQLTPSKPDWAGGLRDTWLPGSAGAIALLDEFMASGLKGYADRRNRPDQPGTSRLSPHLQWGEISPRQIWRVIRMHADANPALEADAVAYLRELGWRDFAHVLLYHAETLAQKPIRTEFNRFPWLESRTGLSAWQRGKTGYPIVDAGMRELWHTGWMHNRVRMITASFLVKNLLIDWREGEQWFWDTLVDACPANNPASWQWVAGCGADAAPFFRIFNPILQSEKFDPEGHYIRRWVPELARLPTSAIHRPWQADPAVLRQAGVTLGKNYPMPVIDHAVARDRALAALATLKLSA